MPRSSVLVALFAIACRDQAPPSPAPLPVKVVVTPPVIAPVISDAAVAVEDLHHRLSATEGTITAAPLHGALDHTIAAAVTVTPASEYQINTDLQPHLELAPPAAVEATPVRLAHWDHDKLALALEVTAHEAGSYAIHGTLHFAVCKRDQCFPKDEPIELALEIH